MAAPAAAQRLIVRTLLSLPAPILRLMAGGGVVYKGGRTLDPRLQFLAVQARKGPAVESQTPEEARRGETAAIAEGKGPASDSEYMTASCIGIAREVCDKMLMRRPIDTAAASDFACRMILGGVKGLYAPTV